jgi:hypothetical protein
VAQHPRAFCIDFAALDHEVLRPRLRPDFFTFATDPTLATNLARFEQVGLARSLVSAALLPAFSFEALTFFVRARAWGPTFTFLTAVGGGRLPTGGGVWFTTASGVTVTVNEAVPVLPAASVAEQVTDVVPTGNVVPEAGVQATAGAAGPPESVAVAEKVTAAPAALEAPTVMLAGTVTTGAVESTTLTVNDAVPVLAVGVAVSVAEQVTVVVPGENSEPDARLHVTGRGPDTASLAVAVQDTGTGAPVGDGWVMFTGTVTVGEVVSCTVTVNDFVSVPDTLVEVQVMVVRPSG